MAASKVDIYFFRHGLADWPDWHRPDDERPLNQHGQYETRDVAAYLRGLDLKIQRILTSPLPRASQTADIVAEFLSAPIEVTKYLDKRFSVRALRKILPAYADNIMLVGHEPNFSEVIGKITGGKIKLRKSGVARVRMDPKKMRGRLDWLLSPETCRQQKKPTGRSR